MRRVLNPFILLLTAILGLSYAYIAWRLLDSTWARAVIAIPFLTIWSLPVLYWAGAREERGFFADTVHCLAYLSMGWLSFVLVFSLGRDVVQALLQSLSYTDIALLMDQQGSLAVWSLSLVGFMWGIYSARRGPSVKNIAIPLATRDPKLAGLRVVQISDLHVGMMIRRPYVEGVVRKTRELQPDIIVLTGDIVDGPLQTYASQAEVLRDLTAIAPCFYITGNHEYYADGLAWVAYFEQMGMTVLRNNHVTIPYHGSTVLVAGVPDPAERLVNKDGGPDCQRAMHERQKTRLESEPTQSPSLKILLAHNPKLAANAELAGFDLQLSGHTHAGQFFPWTIVTRLVHAPHYVGLSQRRRLWVYVSAGTGSWGPPVRFGTRTELTCVRITASTADV